MCFVYAEGLKSYEDIIEPLAAPEISSITREYI